MASRGADIPGLVIRCIASTSSGARFFVKMAIILETGSNSLQYFIIREILAETRFYALHLRGVAHVPHLQGEDVVGWKDSMSDHGVLRWGPMGSDTA